MTVREISGGADRISEARDDAEIELLSFSGQPSQPKFCNQNDTETESPQQLWRWKRGSILVDILGVLLVVPFLFLIIYCAGKHKQIVDENVLSRMNQGLWLSATAFTLVFSAIVSRMTRRIAEWRLERGSSLQTLETLNGSSTLTNTVITQIRLRYFGILPICLALLWSVSPIGSQSPLYILSTSSTSGTAQQTVGYIPVNSTSVIDGAADLKYYAPYINALYTTSLIAAGSFGTSSMDPWSNVKIPRYESLSSAPNATGWVPVPTGVDISYSALTGAPIGELKQPGNVTAVIESTYFQLALVNTSGKLELNGDGIVANLTINGGLIPWNVSNVDKRSESNLTGVLEKAYVTFSPVSHAFKATFEWSQKFVDSEIECVVTGVSASSRNCEVKAMKISRSNTTPRFGFITVKHIQSQWNTLLSGHNFSLSEAYIRKPRWPLDADLSDSSTASPSMSDLTTRLQQLLNTFFFSTIDPIGLLQGEPSQPTQADAFRAFYNPGSICEVDFVLLGIFLAATVIMAASAVVTVVLTILSLNPDILGYVSTFIWHSPSLGLPRSGTFMGADQKTRSIKPLEVRFGDVRSGGEVGRLSVGRAAETDIVQQGRLYI